MSIPSDPTPLGFSAEQSGLGWITQHKFWNTTNTSSGPQTFQLGALSGSPLYGSAYNITLENSNNGIVFTDAPNSGPPHYITVEAQTNSPTFAANSTATLTNVGDRVYLWINQGTNLYSWIEIDLAGPGSSGGGSGGGSGSTYPPPRTSRFISAAGLAIGVAWNTYQIYSSASGSSPIGGAGGGGWIYDMVQNEEANEVSVSIEVGANLIPSFSLGSGPGLINQGSVSTIQPGDELYIEFDDQHDDTSETPNMTITSEVTDPTTTPATTTNPSNTVDNTVTAGSSGSVVYITIGSVKKPYGTIYIKEKTPSGQADNTVASFQVKFNNRCSSNFW